MPISIDRCKINENTTIIVKYLYKPQNKRITKTMAVCPMLSFLLTSHPLPLSLSLLLFYF